MITAIFVLKQTTLTIDLTKAPELPMLDCMVGNGGSKSVRLQPGKVNEITAAPGDVFRMLMNHGLTVVASDPADAHIAATTKDGGSPDPPKSTVHFDPLAVQAFFKNATALGATI